MENAALPGGPSPPRRTVASRICRLLFLLGVANLIFLAGGVVIYFDLPPASFLKKAFVGAQAWHERRHPDPEAAIDIETLWRGPRPGLVADWPHETFDGFTLYTSSECSQAVLVNMLGDVVQTWELPFRKAWPKAAHVKMPVDDQLVQWFRAYLFPNGDLLAVYMGVGDTPYGYGLAKMDRDSKVIWTYSAHAHHDFDVGEDGRIYVLTQSIKEEPSTNLKNVLPSPMLEDSMAVLSAEGKELRKISLIEALASSPYALLLDRPKEEWGAKGDILHANSIRVLKRGYAEKFGQFREGQVLVSLRNLHAIVMIDMETECVTWAAQGPWRWQHDAEFLDNGHLLLYDNLGAAPDKGPEQPFIRAPYHSRVLEIDPLTHAITWFYDGDGRTPFFNPKRCGQQRLPNGNTLIVDSDAGRIIEVTPGKKTVWEYAGPKDIMYPQRNFVAYLTSARRYTEAELPFLKGTASVRP